MILVRVALPAAIVFAGCGASASEAQGRAPARHLRFFLGWATYYDDSLAGRRTASGERYDPAALTAAHRTLPFGTRLRVTRIDTGASVEVRVNDRGPYGRNRRGRGPRVLDLSRAAMERLDGIAAGVVRVRVEVLDVGPRSLP
ncbi:MAG: septal ring lytic transglycosylase RlpA family protein, partial [Myxococcales bacterium]|nr:septal ring lytic transglycosylase RlpA family protein [Myxococcales bacterium]